MIELSPDLMAAVSVALFSSGAAVWQWYKKGEKPALDEIPLKENLELIDVMREEVFDIDEEGYEDDPSFTTDLSMSEIKNRLAKQCMQPDHLFSYHYEDEEINMVLYFMDKEANIRDRQLHVRAIDEGSARRVYAHDEPHWMIEPEEHLSNEHMRYDPAIEKVEEMLEDPEPFEYPTID